jgi:hypothetical protein
MSSDLIKDIILLLVGGVIGYLGLWIPLIRKKMLQREARKRKELLNPENVYDWLIEYHNRKDTADDLFVTSIGTRELKIPFLVKRSWLYYKQLDIYLEEALQYHGKGGPFRIDQKLINKKIKLNQTIFDEPTIYIEKVSTSEGPLTIDVKECRYFEMISSISALEEETLLAIQRKRYSRLPIRDLCLASVTVAEKPHSLPFSVGCVVLLAFRTSTGFELLLQRRSAATATYGGYKSVIPSYGLSPQPKSSPYSISFYNFVKEFAEEIFDFEGLIRHMSSKKGDLLWFLDAPDLKELIESFKSGGSEYIFTGFGIDILNGTNTLSYLCIINNPLLIQRLKSKIEGSWESEADGTDLALELVNIDDPKLFNEIMSRKFHFGSVFCILRGLEYIRLNKAGDNFALNRELDEI